MQALHHWGFYPALPKSSGSFARSKAGRRGKGWMGNRQLLASRTWLAGICLALLCTAGVTPAVTQEQARRQTEASMLLTGMIEIRSEEHTSELQSLMRNSYAVFCLKKKNKLNK